MFDKIRDVINFMIDVAFLLLLCTGIATLGTILYHSWY